MTILDSDAFPRLRDHWFVLCRSAALKAKPLSRTLLGQPLVLFRGAGGVASALLDRCPHRNAPLSRGWVAEGCVVCPYHGWRFEGDGRCAAVPGLEMVPPARAVHATAFPTVEQDGLVWGYGRADVAPGAPPPRLPLWGEPRYTRFVGEATTVGSLPNALENFLDGTHTHYVHSGLIRREGARRAVRARVHRHGDRVEATYLDEGQQSGLIARLFGAGIDETVGRFILPSWAQLEYRAAGRVRLLITLLFTPEGVGQQRLYAAVAGEVPPRWGKLAVPVVQALFLQVLRQDKRILEMQRATIERFGGEQFATTDLDLLRPHIVRLLTYGPTAPGEDVHTDVMMML